MRNTRCHKGDRAEINTLPRTSEGQKGAVAVRGSLNKRLLDPLAEAHAVRRRAGEQHRICRGLDPGL
jgi:hypothetical protein